MIRIVRLPDGHLEMDPLQKKNGRSAYICRDPGCLDKAVRSRGIQRSLKTNLTEEMRIKLYETVNCKKDQEGGA